MSWTGRTLVGLAALVFLAVGCNESTAPEIRLTVTNNPDDFAAQSVNVLNGNLDQEYTWQNSGTRANVTNATVVSGGIARVVIRDAANVIVYDKALTPTSSEPILTQVAGASDFESQSASAESTQAGVAGTWRIEILLSGFSGTFNLLVQKL